MEPQVLEKSSVTTPHELERAECVDQVSDRKIRDVDGAVIIVRWLSILFCLAFWYGIYTVIKLLIGS